MDKLKIKLGAAPIAWTNDDLPDLGSENTFAQCVSEMALAGYVGTEIGTKYPKETHRLKKALELRGLVVCNAWFSGSFTSKPYDDVIEEFKNHCEFMSEMGAKVIGAAEVGNSVQGLQLPVIDAKPFFTEEQWKLVGRGFKEMAKIAEEKGIVLAYHHHMGTGVQTPSEIDRFMEETDGMVKLLFDTGHLVYSEGSQKAMLAVLRKYEGRIAHVHLKDIRPEMVKKVIDEKLSFLDGVRLGTFTVPGDGFIEFKPVFDELERQNYEGWMVVEAEQDPAIADPYEYALKARHYIHELTGL